MAEQKEDIFGFESLQEFSQTWLKNLVMCTKASNEMIKSHDDHEFWTGFEQYQDFCASTGTSVLKMIGDILRHQGVQCRWSQSVSKHYPHNDIDDRFDSIVEANDILLERIDTQLDEIINPSNSKKILPSATTPVNVSIDSSWNKRSNEKKLKHDRWRKFNLITARNIERPQLKWKRKVDNSNAPFVPILKQKPNAIKEWRPSQRFEEDGRESKVMSTVDDFIHSQRLGEDFDMFEDRHPYRFELESFEPVPWQLEKGAIEPYKGIEKTSLTVIDDVEKLNGLLEKLKAVKEVAIDLEHHSYRSFMGFCCLMQISTREEDFIVDTIVLREDLQVLNEVFTNPGILKVMHGADQDIEWLQRDFGLYIVNMFDTGQAARILQLARFSLAFLLKEYCDIAADKQYQLADWRLRPLPDEMVKYAREDTHYLLYIYDKLRDILFEKAEGQSSLMKAVYQMSKKICLKVYEKPIFTPDAYMDICTKYKKKLNDQQLECLRLLVAWRDRTAREEDESYGYVIPNHMMLRIAEQLPREPEGVLACCNPIPPLVRQRVAEIYNLVKEARIFNAKKLSGSSNTKPSEDTSQPKRKEKDDSFVETLEGSDYYSSAQTGFEIYTPSGPSVKKLTVATLFHDEPDKKEKTDNERKARFILESFRSPFELYLPKERNSTDPAEINKKWKQSTVTFLEQNKEAETETAGAGPSSEDNAPKRKSQEESTNSSQKTLRDELVKKQKKGALSEDPNSGSESPVLFSYEKAATGPAFVPFDYSKAGKIKTEPGSSNDVTKEQLGNIVEAPLKKGDVRAKKRFQRGGGKSMSYKR
ncbi:exosome complex component 10-like [Rhopilema esculentum]|uniref:exosome complex component 10-like n=1 Tax=Rhopilema esculentum TaxID=499914 RepID=UPI0031D540EC